MYEFEVIIKSSKHHTILFGKDLNEAANKRNINPNDIAIIKMTFIN